MTRTDVVASSRPRKAAATNRKGVLRKLAVLPIALALMAALVVPTSALAAESQGLSGYGSKPKATNGTSPSKESSTPTKTTAPETTKSEPTASTEPTATKASTLPFTGFDVRWTIGGGVLLIAMGFTLVTAQRRQRRDSGR